MSQTDSKNSSGQEQRQTSQVAQYPLHFEDDTINFYELWITFWKRKWLVIAVTVVVTLGSFVYVLVTPRVYKAKALLLPPNNIQSLNVIAMNSEGEINTNTFRHSASFIFEKFKENLISRSIHKKFILEYGLMDYLAPNPSQETKDQTIYNQFAELINVEEENGITSLSVELHDAEIAAQWVNDLTKHVDKETIAMLVKDLQNSIANQIRDVEYTIASKRQMAKKRREDSIIQFQEAASIANKLGIMEMVTTTNVVQNNQLNITTSNLPLYYRGYRALNTEISFLKSRESDDPFIVGLRDLQERLALLRTINFDKEKMSSVYIDQAAYPPIQASKPKRRLIVSLATVVGLFSGIILAFFIEFVQNQRKNKYSK